MVRSEPAQISRKAITRQSGFSRDNVLELREIFFAIRGFVFRDFSGRTKVMHAPFIWSSRGYLDSIHDISPLAELPAGSSPCLRNKKLTSGIRYNLPDRFLLAYREKKVCEILSASVFRLVGHRFRDSEQSPDTCTVFELDFSPEGSCIPPSGLFMNFYVCRRTAFRIFCCVQPSGINVIMDLDRSFGV
jgi:hypothetical protein